MSDDDEQRSHPRREVELPVALGDRAHAIEAVICFDTCDLSPGGAFLRSDLLLEVGEELELSFRLPDGTSIRTMGRVVHVVRQAGPASPAGMGIEFSQLCQRDRDAVRAFLAGG